jgi:endonuclease/exonuclease/phosphatase family metal-dependent hydrolase
MRIATFNLESLDLPPKAAYTLAERADVLRPELQRIAADILCLQEVNGQHVPGEPGRVLAALDALLADTPYAAFHRAATHGPKSGGVADVHNLVTLSRWPITRVSEIRHDKVAALDVALATAVPPSAAPEPQPFERPLLVTDIALPSGDMLTVANVHLRAPLAAAIRGQKRAPFVWRSVAGWAEGFYLSAMKRTGQALELRLVLEELLDADVHRLIVVAGDFNAEDHETPMKIIVGAQEDTGNGDLEKRAMIVLDRAIPADRRWSVLHHGRPQMLDHILASRTLYGRFSDIAVHNEALGDEAVGYGKGIDPPGSYHAAVVATFRD